MFYYYLLFQLTNEINSLFEKNYGDRYRHYKLRCVSRLSR